MAFFIGLYTLKIILFLAYIEMERGTCNLSCVAVYLKIVLIIDLKFLKYKCFLFCFSLLEYILCAHLLEAEMYKIFA